MLAPPPPLHLPRVADVRLEGQSAGARPLRPWPGRARGAGRVLVDRGDRDTLLPQVQRDRLAQPATRACDERRTALEVPTSTLTPGDDWLGRGS